MLVRRLEGGTCGTCRDSLLKFWLLQNKVTGVRRTTHLLKAKNPMDQITDMTTKGRTTYFLNVEKDKTMDATTREERRTG